MIRLLSNIPTRGVGTLRKKSEAGSSTFSVGNGAEATTTINSMLMSTALPLDDTHTQQDKQAIRNGQICLDDLERWRRRWIQQGGGSVEDLLRIQGTLKQGKPSSAQLQSLLDEVSILVAVEIAKRSHP